MPDALSALRDIHMPSAAPWWPLAYGYWILLALLLVGLYLALRYYQRFDIRRDAQKQFNTLVRAYQQHQNQRKLARQLSVLLRRVVLTLRPRDEVAGLTGTDWISALHQLVEKKNVAFSQSSVAALTENMYAPNASIDIDGLLSDCRRWITSVPPRSRR